jgi:hypothetical protein
MSDREAFEKWAQGKSLLINIREEMMYAAGGYINVKEMAWEAWQAAQAQTLLEVIRDTTGCPTKALQSGEPVGHALACGDPEVTIATFNADRVSVGTKLYTNPQPVNQQLVEALQAVLDCGSTSDQWWIDKAREALLSAGKGGEE